MRVWVGGRAGSGKSAVNSELQTLGYNSYDSDKVPGLASWQNALTGQPAEIDPARFVDYSKYAWNWNPNVLDDLLSSYETIILCGSASNDLDFFTKFDKVFVLTIDPERQLEYLRSRAGNYAKDPRQQKEILAEQPKFVEMMIRLGAVAIKNDRPINEIATEIVRKAGV